MKNFRTFASFEEKKLKEPEEKKRKVETDCSCHTVLPMKEYSFDEIRLLQLYKVYIFREADFGIQYATVLIQYFRFILKYIYTGEIINKCYTAKDALVKYCCLEKKNHYTSDTKGNLNTKGGTYGCTFACGTFKRSEAKVNCIFIDFSKFQRLVELAALIESESMTEKLFKYWCSSDRYNAEEYCSSTKDLNLKCQYYTNMYKLAINLCDKQKDEGSMKWKAKNQIEKYLIRHSKEITSTGIYNISTKVNSVL